MQLVQILLQKVELLSTFCNNFSQPAINTCSWRTAFCLIIWKSIFEFRASWKEKKEDKKNLSLSVYPLGFEDIFCRCFLLCYNAYLCWLVMSECRLLEYWTCMQEPFMPGPFQSMETVNITFLYLLLRRAEYLGQEERFLWLICSHREHLPQDCSLFRSQLLQLRFWSWLPQAFTAHES